MAGDGLRDARGVPFDVVPDGECLVIVGTGQPLRLGMAEREAFAAAYKETLAEVEARDGR